MAVHIRLARTGAKKKPFYRLVVTDQRAPRGGRFLEKIGTFDPSKKESVDGLVIDQVRLDYWRSKGAQPSDTVERLLKGVARAARAAAEAK
jgi:small subunit ribosomal protein S16